MQKIVIAKFTYHDPKTGEEYHVQRGWPCKDQEDAERTVKYYGMKSGAFNAQCIIEDVTDEEIKQATSSTATKEKNQTQPIA